MTDAPDPDQLRSDAVRGVNALIRLLGADPDGPRTGGTAERFVAGMLAMTDPARSPQVLHETVSAVLAEGTGSRDEQIYRAIALPVCDQHLQPFAVAVTVAYDPGHDGLPVNVDQLARITSLHTGGLNSPRRIAERLVRTVCHRMGGDGVGVQVTVLQACLGVQDNDNLCGQAATVRRGVYREVDTRWQQAIDVQHSDG